MVRTMCLYMVDFSSKMYSLYYKPKEAFHFDITVGGVYMNGCSIIPMQKSFQKSHVFSSFWTPRYFHQLLKLARPVLQVGRDMCRGTFYVRCITSVRAVMMSKSGMASSIADMLMASLWRNKAMTSLCFSLRIKE